MKLILRFIIFECKNFPTVERNHLYVRDAALSDYFKWKITILMGILHNTTYTATSRTEDENEILFFNQFFFTKAVLS